MPYAKKPAFEGYRARLISNGKPLLEKDIVPLQAAIIAHLDTIPELLIQKARRQGHKDTLIELTGTWVGLDASQTTAVAILKRFWPGRLFEGVEEQHYVGDREELVCLEFAASYPLDRFLTGRLLLSF